MPPRKSPRNRAAAPIQEAQDKVVEKVNSATTKAKKAIKAESKAETITQQKPKATATAAGKKRKAAEVKVEAGEEEHECDSHGEDDADEEEDNKPKPKKRRTKKDKEDDAMPLAERTAVSSLNRAMYIGAHVSGAGGKAPSCLPYTYYPTRLEQPKND